MGMSAVKPALTTSCPQDWSCASVTEQGDPSFICVPNDTFLCRPESDDDCNVQGYPSQACAYRSEGRAASAQNVTLSHAQRVHVPVDDTLGGHPAIEALRRRFT